MQVNEALGHERKHKSAFKVITSEFSACEAEHASPQIIC